eukprot:TRINITY_DN11547_c2_g1_i1.p1 TRINITY_DN11547_c2_g1~~TRINITY_DN11547_c2_g1_i1.p1  ORF type:complete len:390 (+),score=60.82 TRINITY_DN11547_c2_g1_i1:68-1237(+)
MSPTPAHLRVTSAPVVLEDTGGSSNETLLAIIIVVFLIVVAILLYCWYLKKRRAAKQLAADTSTEGDSYQQNPLSHLVETKVHKTPQFEEGDKVYSSRDKKSGIVRAVNTDPISYEVSYEDGTSSSLHPEGTLHQNNFRFSVGDIVETLCPERLRGVVIAIDPVTKKYTIQLTGGLVTTESDTGTYSENLLCYPPLLFSIDQQVVGKGMDGSHISGKITAAKQGKRLYQVDGGPEWIPEDSLELMKQKSPSSTKSVSGGTLQFFEKDRVYARTKGAGSTAMPGTVISVIEGVGYRVDLDDGTSAIVSPEWMLPMDDKPSSRTQSRRTRRPDPLEDSLTDRPRRKYGKVKKEEDEEDLSPYRALQTLVRCKTVSKSPLNRKSFSSLSMKV